jgi:hypothetical protein
MNTTFIQYLIAVEVLSRGREMIYLVPITS